MSALRQYAKMMTEHPLGRKHPFRCAARILRWQVVGRLSHGSWVVDFVGGQRLMIRHGETGLTVHYYTGLYEFEDMIFVYHALRPEDLFVDVGANAGAYTVLAAGAAGARAVAFEPVPQTFELLVDNIALNGLGQRVDARNVAVGSQDGKLTMTTGLAAQNRVETRDVRDSNTIDVPVVRLDDLLPESSKGAIVLKIDVEGWESEVLKGAGAVLARRQPLAILVEMNQSGERYGRADSDLRDLLLAHNLVEVAYDPWARALNRGESPVGPNRLFVSDEEFFRERVHSARSLDVWGHSI
jgi:FkbM family methyltransferase